MYVQSVQYVCVCVVCTCSPKTKDKMTTTIPNITRAKVTERATLTVEALSRPLWCIKKTWHLELLLFFYSRGMRGEKSVRDKKGERERERETGRDEEGYVISEEDCG